MTVSVHIELGYEFEVKAPFDKVFGVLADVPESASHFPKVERLTDLGDGVYRWEMQKVGTQQVHVQTIYASRYVSDRAKGTVTWTPVKGIGNAQVGGSWKVTRAKGTKCALNVAGTLELPLPALMKPIVGPVMEAEFEKLADRYVANLVRTFGGEV